MKGFRGIGHAVLLTLIGTLAIFINASSEERPLGRHDNALLPLIRNNQLYLLKGLDLSPEGIGPRLPPISLQGQDLSGMDLREARFTPRRLRGIRIRGAHMARADFSCAALEDVDFSGADLSEARFDFSDCGGSKQSRECSDSDEVKIDSCSLLQVNLKGANLSRSLLQGKMGGTAESNFPESSQFCKHWLVIKGDLDGARFSDATLRCVLLINDMSETSAISSREDQQAVNAPASPDYAGISFVHSTLENVILGRGNFVFSEFWQARVVRMWVNLPSVDLRFTSLAKLQCPPEGCELLIPTLPADNNLSLSVRGSHIRSNMWLSNSTRGWPALLCDRETKWIQMIEPKGEVPCNTASGLLVQR